jgi:hypothetical protein
MHPMETEIERRAEMSGVARARGEANREANRVALKNRQPWLPALPLPGASEIEWIFARDGALTALLPGERWFGGCSLPRRAAEFMFRTLEIQGTVGCFLSPTHAAQLRVALNKLEPRQAIIAIVPDAANLEIILHCEDFLEDIARHRLWFVAGEGWKEQIKTLFEDIPGLPTPSQFIRPIVADAGAMDGLIAPAQAVFSEAGTSRIKRIRAIVEAQSRPAAADRLCLIAPSHFRLWEQSSETLAGVLENWSRSGGKPGICRIDTDDPASASPLALARVASECDAVVAANIFRADAQGAVSPHVPWLTWVTAPRVRPPDGAAPHDRLLLADESWRKLAAEVGWTQEQVQIAAWPRQRIITPHQTSARKFLAIVADTQLIEAPEQVNSYSSQLLLWELIESELKFDPFLVSGDMHEYLASRRDRLQIADAGFDATLFIDRLIAPAYQQGIARLLIGQNLPVRLSGRAWDTIADLAQHHEGRVESREHLNEILSSAAAVVHAWPFQHAHPVDAIGLPVIRAMGRGRDGLLRDAGRALDGRFQAPAHQDANALSAKLIGDLLARL